jgi:hypothetical protein
MVFGPDRPATGRERWLVALVAFGVITMLVAEIATEYRPGKLSAPFMVLSLGPLVLIHEAGHALASRAAGWKICHIVIGRGRPLLRLRAGAVPVDVHWIPVGGYVLPARRCVCVISASRARSYTRPIRALSCWSP